MNMSTPTSGNKQSSWLAVHILQACAPYDDDIIQHGSHSPAYGFDMQPWFTLSSSIYSVNASRHTRLTHSLCSVPLPGWASYNPNLPSCLVVSPPLNSPSPLSGLWSPSRPLSFWCPPLYRKSHSHPFLLSNE